MPGKKAVKAVQLVCSSSVNPYYRRAHDLVLMGQQQAPKTAISEMAALLKRLLEEIVAASWRSPRTGSPWKRSS
jgi:hypothetical protein